MQTQLVKNPTIYVLDDRFVAEFSVEVGEYEAKVECLMDKENVLDYTIEFNGPVEKRNEMIQYAQKKAKEIMRNHLVHR